MNTRALVPSDALALAALWLAGAHESAAVHSAFRPRVGVAEYAASVEDELRSGACIGWGVFDDEGLLLGYLTARIAQPAAEFEPSNYLYLLDLDVHASVRRQGVGRRLVEQARRHAREQGLRSIEVSWLSGDARASAFWQQLGFAPYLARAQLAIEPLAQCPENGS